MAVVAFALVPGAKADVSVATSGTFTAAYLELVPQLERVTNDKIVTAATSMGVGADSIPSRVQRRMASMRIALTRRTTGASSAALARSTTEASSPSSSPKEMSSMSKSPRRSS
jgi:hypothetical protein